MMREDIVSFCQFLLRHRQIVSDTARKVLAEFDKDPLSGGPLTILRRDGAAKRSGAILIVQFLSQQSGLWLGESCEPIRLADLWEKNPDGSFDSGTFKALMRGETPVSQRAFPADADTVAGAPAQQGSYIAPRKVSARQAQQAPIQTKQPALVQIGKHLIPPKLGPYIVEKQLGEGGMGAVFQVLHERTKLNFALKMATAADQRDPEAVQRERERFIREATALLRVTSPYVARAYEMGEDGTELYLVMEAIRGKDLISFVQDLPADDPLAIVRLVRDAAKGVQAFHAVGLIHRDIKPSNVMVDESGCPKVIDSGLVRSVTGPRDTQRLATMPTEADLTNGTMLGTPAYMAPEQALSQEVSPASDVYALLGTLYYLLTGKLIFEGSSLNILSKVCQEHELPAQVERALKLKFPFGGLSKRMLEIFRKGRAFRKEDRYQNAGEFVAAVDEVLTWWRDREAEKATAQAQELEHQLAKNRKLVGGLAILAILTVVAVVFAVLIDGSRRSEQARAEAESKRAQAESRAKDEAEARALADRNRAQAEQRRADAETLRVEAAAQFLECQALMRSAQWVRAETALLILIDRDSSYEPARYALGQVQFNLRKVVCAEQWLWLVEHGSVTRRSEYAFYAMFAKEELDPKLSRAPYRDLLAQITDTKYQAMAEVYLDMAEAEEAFQSRQTDRANQLLEQATTRIPALADTDELAWLAYGLRGFVAWRIAQLLPAQQQAPKLTEAMMLLNRSVGRNPDFPMTWQWLGMVLRQLNQSGAASAAFERLECLMPNWPVPRYMKQDCRLIMAGQLQPPAQMAVADEAQRVCEDLQRVGGLEPRQSIMTRMVLMRAHLARSVAYSGLGRTTDEQAEVQVVFRLAEELVREPGLLPDETAYLNRILSKRRQK